MSFSYPSIQNLYRRDPATHRVLVGEYTEPWMAAARSLLFRFTEKMDGMNVRIIFDEAGAVRFAGRTDAAQMPYGLAQHLEALRPTLVGRAKNITVYGEGFGEGVQKGGWYGSARFIAFDIWFGFRDLDGFECGRWADWDELLDLANNLGLPVVPTRLIGTLDEGRRLVEGGLHSTMAADPAARYAEGLVGRALGDFYTSRGERIVVKIKDRDFGPATRETINA